MKNNRSLQAMLSAIRVSMTSGLRSKGFRRAVGMLLVVANLMTTTGMVLAKEMDDETQETSSGIVATLQEEPSSETTGDPSEEKYSVLPDETDSSSDPEITETPESSDSSITPPEGSSDPDGSADPGDSSDVTSDGTTSEDISTADSESSLDASETEMSSDGMDSLKDGMCPALPDDPSLMDPSMVMDENTTMKTFKGDTYSVVVAYGPETGIPSDAMLSVSEITDEQMREAYCEKLNSLVDSGKVNTARFFDISLLVNDVEVEPLEGTIVSVKILLDEILDGNVSVVHLPEDKEADVVDTTANNTEKGMEIRFETEGFSAYAIVTEENLVASNRGWINLSSISDLEQYASGGVYINSTGYDSSNGGGYHFLTSSQTAVSGGRYGITKTRYPYPDAGDASLDPLFPAVPFFFEDLTPSADGKSASCKIYCLDSDGVTKKYVVEQTIDTLKGSLSFGTPEQAATFTVEYKNNNQFTVKGATHYWNEQGGVTWPSGSTTPDGSNKSISEYNSATRLQFSTYLEFDEDPYGLAGKTYSLLNWGGGSGGRALQAEVSDTDGNLKALPVTVVSKKGSQNEDLLFVSADDEAAMWTFEYSREDFYNLRTTVDGQTKYLKIDADGLSLSDTPYDIQIIPGTGSREGQLTLKSGANILTFSGSAENGFNINDTANKRWLYLVEEKDLTPDYQKTYSARKISVSDDTLKDGSQVIVYTRRWEYDEAKQKYEYKYYAINHDGTLLECFESGDYLQWSENMINTLLWDFEIYYWDDFSTDKENENNYYELYNEYSQKYIAPQITDGQYLSDSPIGIQLDGRRKDRYYSSIIAWDDTSYAYASLVTEKQDEERRIRAGAFADAEDFYFATIEDATESDDELHELATVNNNLYGIYMKMQDFSNRTVMSNALGNDDGEYRPGLLSTKLEDNGYPKIMSNGNSLNTLFTNPREVNHLFVESTHSATGYFEYDSTQNFASLRSNGNFVVYQELGTNDKQSKTTLKHGQFLPYNDITAGSYATKNSKNLYSMNARLNSNTAGMLPDSDPRKYEPLYLVNGEPNFYFGMEMTSSFIQTPSGLDDWGHDIIYEFTGDDDFWFYVDGELVIDLGGIRSAMAGTINFATGEVVVDIDLDGTKKVTTLRDIFYDNYLHRDDHTEEEAQAYVDSIFYDDGEGHYVFKDYTTHEMKAFYLERGAGASNLHMKFNQSSVKPGRVVLGKEVGGIDATDSVLAEFPYQIFFRKKDVDGVVREYPLTNSNEDVLYRGTDDPIPFSSNCTIDGVNYDNVFFLKPGEECEFSFPADTIEYRVVECGVNPFIYSKVKVNGDEVDPSVTHVENGRSDYGIDWEEVKNRTNVQYINEVNPDALRVLNIQKKLYKEDGVTEIIEDENTTFNFRLYLAGEFDSEVSAAYMYNYHVKDRDGNYCVWDPSTAAFSSLGVSDFGTLSETQKQKATFQTSMNGSISKIPTGYSVEIRGLMVGTKYKVEERDNEIPDGFSRRDYDYFEDKENEQKTYSSLTAVSETMGENKNPLVIVNNLKGYGLRINKEWTDKDFMYKHGDVYFAVYTYVDGVYSLAGTDAVHCITDKGNTSYWYYEHLEPGLSLANYEIHEVKLGGPVTVNENGVVTGYSTITRLDDNDTVTVPGQMMKDAPMTDYDYTVSYTLGSVAPGSNVREDFVTNDRPGLGMTKTKWDGTVLPNAEFTVTSDDGTFKKRFVSDENGNVTKAFFMENMIYHINEIKTPIGYYCPTEAIDVVFRNGEFEIVDTSAGAFGTVVSKDDKGNTLLGIKNMTYNLRVLKVDAIDDQPIQGAHFALHKQIKVGGVTMFDYSPVPGFDDLVSDIDGIIPLLDNQLAPGVYELRETEPPVGYVKLMHNIRFRVGDTGGVTLLDNYADVTLSSTRSADSSEMDFEMVIRNSSDSKRLIVTKTVSGNLGSRDEKFDFSVSFADAENQAYQDASVMCIFPDGTAAAISLDDTGTTTFQLAHGETIQFVLPADAHYTVTETSSGYETTYRVNGGSVQTGATAAGQLTGNMTVAYTNTRKGIIPTGVDYTGRAILGATLLLLISGSIFAIGKRRKAFACAEEDDRE